MLNGFSVLFLGLLHLGIVPSVSPGPGKEIAGGSSPNCTAVTTPPELGVFSLAGGRGRCAGELQVGLRFPQDGRPAGPVCRESLDNGTAGAVCTALGCGALLSLQGAQRDTLGYLIRNGTVESSQCMAVAHVVCQEKSRLPVRLASAFKESAVSCAGLVQIRAHDGWKYVCVNKDTWDLNFANETCQEVGCGNLIHHSAVPATPEGTTGVFCNSTNADLLRCPMLVEKNETCLHARVVCQGSPSTLPVSLSGGASHCQGYVRIFYHNQWQPVCPADNNVNHWISQNAKAVCQSLGCGNTGKEAPLPQGRGSKVKGMTCANTSLSLTNCFHYLEQSEGCLNISLVCQEHMEPSTRTLVFLQVFSVLLSMLLLSLILIKFGPRTYHKISKRLSERRERQWIGPTQSHSVSFYRAQSAAQANSTDNKQRLSFPGESTAHRQHTQHTLPTDTQVRKGAGSPSSTVQAGNGASSPSSSSVMTQARKSTGSPSSSSPTAQVRKGAGSPSSSSPPAQARQPDSSPGVSSPISREFRGPCVPTRPPRAGLVKTQAQCAQ
nr:PREDICTED: T-cell surface glycoprotein CD5-like [Lepisosteus oculatus]